MMTRQFAVDALERVAATAAEAAIAVVLLAGTLDISTAHKAAIAGTMAGLAALKALAAAFIGNNDSASVVPSVGAPTDLTAATSGYVQASAELADAARRVAAALTAEKEAKKALARLGLPPPAGDPPTTS